MTHIRPTAFDARLVAHIPMLERLADRHCHPNEREEVVQTTLTAALDGWQSFREDGSFYKWLYWRFRDVCSRLRDRRKRNLVVVDSDLADRTMMSARPQQEDIVFASEVLQRLSRSRGGRMLAWVGTGETMAEVSARRGGLSHQRVQELVSKARRKIAHLKEAA